MPHGVVLVIYIHGILSGLTSYGAIPRCTQLRILNLSLNQLTSLSPLATLTSLQQLDLSANQITNLGQLLLRRSFPYVLGVDEMSLFVVQMELTNLNH